jgi:membrane-associated phospholipid phosphatase
MSAQLQSPPRLESAHRRPPRPHPVGDRKVVALRLVGGAVALWALLSLIGLFVTHVLGSGAGHRADLGVDRWFADHRTSALNTATEFGSGAANTQTAIAVTFVVALLLRWRLGRWYESMVLVTAIAGELVVFLAVTATIHRARPTVPRLDVSPPTSSFPSGHTAAAVAMYGCIAILLLWIYGRRRLTVVAAVLFCCLPVVVGLSRLYRGMHFPSDVVVGALGGGLWLWVVISTLLPATGRRSGEGAQR